MASWTMEKRNCLNVRCFNGVSLINVMHLSLAGRIKLACELLSQYLPRDMLQDLIASYEYV